MSNASGDDEELKALLPKLEAAAASAEVCECFANDCPHEKQMLEARKSVESLFGRIKEERDRLTKVSENFEVLSRGINENSGECSPSCNSHGHAEDCEYVDDAATIRIQQEKLEALRAALQGTDTENASLRAELGRIREELKEAEEDAAQYDALRELYEKSEASQLSPEEARCVVGLLWGMAGTVFEKSIVAKLKSRAGPPDKKEQ